MSGWGASVYSLHHVVSRGRSGEVSGAMGEIFRAIDRRSGDLVALKVLRPETLAKPENRRRFEREILALSRLAHPNIVGSLGADLSGPRPYLAMEYVEGTDLGDWVKRHGPMPVAEACAAIAQAAQGLQHIHKRGLIHRDIKPSNL